MTAHRVRNARVTAALLAVGIAATLAGCTGAVDSEPSTPEMPTSASQPASPPESQNDGVSSEQAGTIATGKYGGTITSIEDDSYNGEPAWEVEIDDSNEGRIEVKVSKANGEILEVEHD